MNNQPHVDYDVEILRAKTRIQRVKKVHLTIPYYVSKVSLTVPPQGTSGPIPSSRLRYLLRYCM